MKRSPVAYSVLVDPQVVYGRYLTHHLMVFTGIGVTQVGTDMHT
jgi:hypothetical protein